MKIRVGVTWLTLVAGLLLTGGAAVPNAEAQDRGRLRPGAPPGSEAGANSPARTVASERRARVRQGTQDPSDPTRPGQEILSRLPSTGGQAAGQQPGQQARRQNMNLSSNLPPIPVIGIRSRIMSSSDEGTVTLVSGGDHVRVKLSRASGSEGLRFPELQFAEYAESVRQLRRHLVPDGEVPSPRRGLANLPPGGEESRSGKPDRADAQGELVVDPLPQMFTIDTTFELAGITYRLVDFDRDAVLLEALPHGRLVIVR